MVVRGRALRRSCWGVLLGGIGREWASPWTGKPVVAGQDGPFGARAGVERLGFEYDSRRLRRDVRGTPREAWRPNRAIRAADVGEWAARLDGRPARRPPRAAVAGAVLPPGGR